MFHRCALQVNPHHYGSTFRGQETDGDPCSRAETIVAKAAEIGISALAITDHSNIEGIAAFRDASKRYGITIFPGFEISSSEGIHVLCIYPPDTDDGSLNRFLGELGIRQTEPSSALSKDSLENLLAKVRAQGGVSIAAHLTSAKGLFVGLAGQAWIKAWRDPNLLAIQIPGPVKDLPHDIRQIVENTNTDYRRDHPVDRKLAMAAINAKDVMESEDLGHESATCWIKMSEMIVEGLRQAFLDLGSRIRLNGDPEPEDHTELVSIAWKGGLNTAPTGSSPSWQALEDLSTGQKATAVLLLLLLESNAPLIVDQPEDDLYNHFITEGVVPKMREEKRRPQFVFSTHNANIPVLGDAELILGLTAEGEAVEGKAVIEPGHVGSIDTPPVRDLVENILEGGKDAFETRRRKYGF